MTFFELVRRLPPACVTASGRLLLYCLAYHADVAGEDPDVTGRAYPSVLTLARETSISRRGVQYHVAKLRALDLIAQRGVSKGKPGPGLYRYGLNVEKLRALAEVA